MANLGSCTSCLGSVVVGDRHRRGDGDEQGQNRVLGLFAVLDRRALVYGNDGGARRSVDEARKSAKLS